GYFLLTISPKDELPEQEYAPKDIVFVLDTSGSIAEDGKREKARAALLFGVLSLRPAHRCNVINFAGEQNLMSAELVQADAAASPSTSSRRKTLRSKSRTSSRR